MIAWFFKYGLVVLILNTILYSIPVTMHTVAPSIFYSLMFLTILFLIINPHHLREVLFHRSFLFILLINCLNLVYFLFFDDIKNQKSLEFLLARFAQYSLISFSVYYNFNYFKADFPNLLVKVIVFVIILGLIFNPFIFDDRYSGILWNPNMLASISVIAFSYLLIKNSIKSNMDYFLLILFFIIAISTGSRVVIIGIALSFIFKFGFSLRNLIYSIFAFLIFLVVVSTDLNTSLNRISSQSIFNDRTLQFELALEGINDKLIKGHGLSNYSGISEIELGEEYDGLIVSAHNGYLSLFIQYGLIFGSLILLIILKKSLSVLYFLKEGEDHLNFYLFIVVYTLIAANFESLITGINEFHTILFWFSLTYLSYSKFLKQYES
jgi:hypothetical protein